jgi:Bacterial aa3 type cytochrome c oxidase subunit IV
MSHDSDYKPGSMDISQHQRAYAGFLTGSKYVFILVALIVVFMAFFRTHT